MEPKVLEIQKTYFQTKGSIELFFLKFEKKIKGSFWNQKPNNTNV